MVKPAVITIDASLDGQKRMDLPRFSGYEILVELRGMGAFTADEITILPTGGFELKGEEEKFILGEVYTVTPLPKPIAPPFSIPLYPGTQYPHRLVMTVVEDSTLDEHGHYQPGATTTVEMACRAEPNRKNGFIMANDGRQIYYDYTIYLPLPCDTIAVGTQVSVYDGDELLTEQTIKRFSRGQLNARAWL